MHKSKWRQTKHSLLNISVTGVGLVMRKMANMAKPTIVISVADDNWMVKTITTVKTTEIRFKLDEEFDEVTADGRKVKVNF